MRKQNYIQVEKLLGKSNDVIAKAKKDLLVNQVFYSIFSIIPLIVIVKGIQEIKGMLIANPIRFVNEQVLTGLMNRQMIGLFMNLILFIIIGIVAIEYIMSTPVDVMSDIDINILNNELMKVLAHQGNSLKIANKNSMGYRTIKKVRIKGC